MEGKQYEHVPDQGQGVLEIYKYADRKQWSLCLTKGSVCYVIAYFRTEARAQMFMDWMSGISRKE